MVLSWQLQCTTQNNYAYEDEIVEILYMQIQKHNVDLKTVNSHK